MEHHLIGIGDIIRVVAVIAAALDIFRKAGGKGGIGRQSICSLFQIIDDLVASQRFAVGDPRLAFIPAIESKLAFRTGCYISNLCCIQGLIALALLGYGTATLRRHFIFDRILLCIVGDKMVDNLAVFLNFVGQLFEFHIVDRNLIQVPAGEGFWHKAFGAQFSFQNLHFFAQYITFIFLNFAVETVVYGCCYGLRGFGIDFPLRMQRIGIVAFTVLTIGIIAGTSRGIGQVRSFVVPFDKGITITNRLIRYYGKGLPIIVISVGIGSVLVSRQISRHILLRPFAAFQIVDQRIQCLLPDGVQVGIAGDRDRCLRFGRVLVGIPAKELIAFALQAQAFHRNRCIVACRNIRIGTRHRAFNRIFATICMVGYGKGGLFPVGHEGQIARCALGDHQIRIRLYLGRRSVAGGPAGELVAVAAGGCLQRNFIIDRIFFGIFRIQGHLCIDGVIGKIGDGEFRQLQLEDNRVGLRSAQGHTLAVVSIQCISLAKERIQDCFIRMHRNGLCLRLQTGLARFFGAIVHILDTVCIVVRCIVGEDDFVTADCQRDGICLLVYPVIGEFVCGRNSTGGIFVTDHAGMRFFRGNHLAIRSHILHHIGSRCSGGQLGVNIGVGRDGHVEIVQFGAIRVTVPTVEGIALYLRHIGCNLIVVCYRFFGGLTIDVEGHGQFRHIPVGIQDQAHGHGIVALILFRMGRVDKPAFEGSIFQRLFRFCQVGADVCTDFQLLAANQAAVKIIEVQGVGVSPIVEVNFQSVPSIISQLIGLIISFATDIMVLLVPFKIIEVRLIDIVKFNLDFFIQTIGFSFFCLCLASMIIF